MHETMYPPLLVFELTVREIYGILELIYQFLMN